MYLKNDLALISRMKELEPRMPDEEITKHFDQMSENLKKKLNEIEEKI